MKTRTEVVWEVMRSGCPLWNREAQERAMRPEAAPNPYRDIDWKPIIQTTEEDVTP